MRKKRGQLKSRKRKRDEQRKKKHAIEKGNVLSYD
jgi:hypothetical protein